MPDEDDDKIATEPEIKPPDLDKIPDDEATGLGYENDPIEDEAAGA